MKRLFVTLKRIKNSRRINRALASRICASILSIAATISTAQTTPEQERLALIRALQSRLPGTQPSDWTLGGDSLTPGTGGNVQAIPFNADNATNSTDILAIGKKYWDRKFKDGKSMTDCFASGGKRVATGYPQYDVKLKIVVTLEMAINRCRQQHVEAEISVSNAPVMGPLSAYARNLSEGQRLALKVSTPAARDKFHSGKSLFTRRIGQQNFACASCHVLQVGKIFGTSEIGGAQIKPAVLSPAIGQAASSPRLEPGGGVRTLQMQYQHCMKKAGAEPLELGSEELNNLEYYHAFLSNGLAIRVLAVQR